MVGPDVTVTGATIDSRKVTGGELFVPVVAERDGHDFVPDALAAGAAAYLTQRPLTEPVAGAALATAVVVNDTVAGLGALARHARSRLTGHVVGVTGSVGKTSVKDLLAAVLGVRWRTAASVQSFNNELGVPLTVLNAAAETEALVVEMGARGVGHIKALCELVEPTVGVVTRVAAAHTEMFGTIDEVARAKGELVEVLRTDGTAVLNADDHRVAAMAERTTARVLLFGDAGDVRAEGIALDDDLRPRFRLVTPWGASDILLAARGRHMVENALAAAAAGLACGVPVEGVAEGLGAAQVSPWRMELVRLPSGARLLNDAYNANPTSMAAALHAVAATPARRRIAVLGPMAELGPTSDDDHRAVGDLARDLGIEVISVGVASYGGHVVDDADPATVVAALGPLSDGDIVLLKASRIAALERIATALTV